MQKAALLLSLTLLNSCGKKPPAPPLNNPPQTPPTASAGCSTVADCAQKAVEAAQASQTVAAQNRIDLNATIAPLNQQVQSVQSQINTIAQNYSNPSNGNTATGPGGNGVLQLTNTVSCPAGQYVAGLTLGWAGTCHGSCDEDGGVLHTVTPICKKLF